MVVLGSAKRGSRKVTLLLDFSMLYILITCEMVGESANVLFSEVRGAGTVTTWEYSILGRNSPKD